MNTQNLELQVENYSKSHDLSLVAIRLGGILIVIGYYLLGEGGKGKKKKGFGLKDIMTYGGTALLFLGSWGFVHNGNKIT